MDTLARVSIAKNALMADVRITDQPTVQYIAAFAEDRRPTAFVNCIQLGARVARFANDQLGAANIAEKIDASAESARKLLASISASTNDHIDRALKTTFGKNGSVSKLLEAQLDGVQRELEGKLDPAKATSITARVREAVKSDIAAILEQIRKELDLTNPQSPIRVLQADVTTKLQALDEKVAQLVTQTAVKSAVTVEHLRGTQKGVDFEDAVHTVLGELTRHRKDQLERTGHEPGLNGRSKRGDFLVEINAREAGGPGLNIVVEAKHNQAKHRDLLRELDLAMDNRSARFGIGISTSRELLPAGAPPIEFGADDKILIRVDDFDPDTGQFDPIYLEVALNVARFVCITNREPQPCGLNVVQLDGNVAQAINALTRLSQLKKHLTSIVGTANEAHGLVDAIRQEIREALQAIRDAVQDGLGSDAPTPPMHLKSA